LGRSRLYTSKFTDEALADVRKLPKNVRNALRGEFKDKIHVDPVGCSEPLEGLLSEYRSFHFGKYRVIYRIFEDIKAVSVVGVGKKDQDHYAEIYRQLEALAADGKLAQAVLETYRSLRNRR
jgi:mRNA-degrading endonuclease RelE of RelBE toxin-antitoxin system